MITLAPAALERVRGYLSETPDAIGLRFGVPIYTVEAVLSEAGIILSDLEEEEADADDSGEEEAEEIVEQVLEEEQTDQIMKMFGEVIAMSDETFDKVNCFVCLYQNQIIHLPHDNFL